jgi:uncharacterized protein YigE (DUF2233 family)
MTTPSDGLALCQGRIARGSVTPKSRPPVRPPAAGGQRRALAMALVLTVLSAACGDAAAQTGQVRAGQVSAGQVSAGEAVTVCRPIDHEGNRYTICEVDLRRQTTRLFWKRPDGEPYGYLGSLPATDPATGGKLQFAVNAGMYHPDYKPVGLYVEGRKELAKASTARGPGNFHMKPNGVFFVAGARAGVMETAAFLKARVQADIATQSGPMLVIDGRLHPRFTVDGESRKGRNGVGMRDANTVVFAISEGEVSFGAFARLFRDALECPNALFLDGGSVPTLYVPGSRSGNLLPLGPMLGVYARK